MAPHERAPDTTGPDVAGDGAVAAVSTSLASPRRRLLLAAMWLSALGAMSVVYAYRTEPTDVAPARAAPGAPLHRAAVASPPTSRERIPVETPAEPAPRMFRGDRRHTGRSPYSGPASAALAWRFETRGRITAQAAVATDGRVFLGSHDGNLYALDASGHELWRRALGGPIYSSPLVDDEGNVYVGSDAKVFVSLAHDGEVRWRLETDGDADTGAVPSPDGSTLYFAAGQRLWAVDRAGDVSWRFQADAKIFTTPAVDADGVIYVGSQDDHVYAVRPDGSLAWAYRTRDDVDSSPVIGDDGTVYVGSDDHHVYALSRDGALRWATDLDGMIRAPVGLGQDGSVLVGVFGPRPRVVGLDAATGVVRWQFPVTVADTTEIGVASGPLVDRDGHVYFGAHDDYVYSLTATGELRWVFEADGDLDASPTLTASGQLLVGSDDRGLYALREGAE